jgi:hypothetical protein
MAGEATRFKPGEARTSLAVGVSSMKELGLSAAMSAPAWL